MMAIIMALIFRYVCLRTTPEPEVPKKLESELSSVREKAKGGKGKTQWKGEKGKGDVGKSAVAEDASSTWGHSGNAGSWSSKPGWSSSWNSQWSWSYRPEWSGWSWHDGRSWSQDNLPWNTLLPGYVWVRLKL